tara:strand:+ start:2960 stop:5977 length:3018 start_codon:yes stop_codon:yes gene_type:complete
MSVKKFKFISPGIFINEIDNSGIPDDSDALGPVIIGRAEKGPALRPVTVSSFSEFVEIFGAPVPGGLGGDVWREGNSSTPMYGTYAAQAWLRNSSPLTFVRLLGDQHTNAVASSYAGWETWLKGQFGTSAEIGTDRNANGGAYGLFLAASGSDDVSTGSTGVTGSLAAVFYLTEGSFELSGAVPGPSTAASASNPVHLSGTAVHIENKAASNTYVGLIKNRSGVITKKTEFNFDKNSDKYIRKVFNTSPIATSNDAKNVASDNRETYWLGETFDRAVKDVVGVSNAAKSHHGVVLGLKSGTSSWQHHREGLKKSETGYVFSQDLRATEGGAPAGGYDPKNTDHAKKLFRFKSLTGGEWNQNNIKISIQDVKVATDNNNPYGSFSVVIREIGDNDGAVKVLERFSSCNLNPNSQDYLGRKIGDKYVEWSDSEARYIEYGNYDNLSNYVYVDIVSDVNAGTTDPLLLPFGFYGPTRAKGFKLGTTALNEPFSLAQHTNGSGSAFPDAYVVASSSIAGSAVAPLLAGNKVLNDVADTHLSGGFTILNVSGGHPDTPRYFVNAQPAAFAYTFPTFALRSSSFDATLGAATDAYFGFDSRESDVSVRFDRSNIDVARRTPVGISADSSETAFYFTLDDVRIDGDGNAFYQSGSRNAGNSVTAVSGTYNDILTRGYDRFTMPLFGGFDGINITDRDPFNSTGMTDKTVKTSSPFYSVKKAVDTVKDPEVVEFNLASMPGIWTEGLTTHLVNTCEDRADALAVIDLKGGYEPVSETGTENLGSVSTTITNLRNRGLNTSYACAYYPWVRIRDSINGALLWAPPSIAAIGTFSSAEANSALWFAPAGFTRGGLTEGSAGIPVVGVRERLTSKQRDDLYEANINPIATFPAEGIVIFGQKTLQVTRSALDRINVRRLLIFVKKEVSRIAATTLFEQNVPETWANFTGRVEPLLQSIQIGLGLTDFRVVLDESTTTDDLIDRNIMYAKIFLKPARAIEYIALDFVVTRSGASFDD